MATPPTGHLIRPRDTASPHGMMALRVLRPGGRAVLNIGEQVDPGTPTHRILNGTVWVWAGTEVVAPEQDGSWSVVIVGHSLGASVGAAVSPGRSAASAGLRRRSGEASPDAFVGYEGPYDEAASAPDGD